MFKLVVKIYNRHFDGDTSYNIETLYVNATQLNNWLERGNTYHVEILSYSRA